MKKKRDVICTMVMVTFSVCCHGGRQIAHDFQVFGYLHRRFFPFQHHLLLLNECLALHLVP